MRTMYVHACVHLLDMQRMIDMHALCKDLIRYRRTADPDQWHLLYARMHAPRQSTIKSFIHVTHAS